MPKVKLSQQALNDLRETLRQAYDDQLIHELDDTGLNQIGNIVLFLMADGIKEQIRKEQLYDTIEEPD